MSGWRSGEHCLIKDASHGWLACTIHSTAGIGADATLSLRTADGRSVTCEGRDVERTRDVSALADVDDMATAPRGEIVARIAFR